MEIKKGEIKFNRTRFVGPVSDTEEVIFDSPLTQATAILTGFDVLFSNREDHHLGNLEIRLDADIDRLAPTRVNVTATFGLRDWSGDPGFDDSYEGLIQFSVIAE